MLLAFEIGLAIACLVVILHSLSRIKIWAAEATESDFSIQYDQNPEMAMVSNVRKVLRKEPKYKDGTLSDHCDYTTFDDLRKFYFDLKNELRGVIVYSEVIQTKFGQRLVTNHRLVSGFEKADRNIITAVELIKNYGLTFFYPLKPILEEYAEILTSEKRKFMDLYMIYTLFNETYNNEMREKVEQSIERIDDINTSLSGLLDVISNMLSTMAGEATRSVYESYDDSESEFFSLQELSEQIQELIKNYNSENPR